MKTRVASLAIALLSTSLACLAQENFVANLDPGQETGIVTFTMSGGGSRPASFGSATLTLSADLSQLTMTITITNIDVNGMQTPGDSNDDLQAAHIHGPAGFGANGGILWGFFGLPDNDDNPNDLVVTPFSVGVGGTFTTVWNASEGLGAQINNIRNGLTYLNFHTTQNGGGEIRGQIVVPEPGTFALLGAGAVAGLVAAWRRRRRALNPRA